jgi:hypothetical protein
MRFFLAALLSLLALPAFAADPTEETLTIGGARVDVRIAADDLAASKADLLAWVMTAGEAVAHFYGKFPASHYRVVIVARTRGRGISGSTRIVDGISQSVVRIPNEVVASDLANDWVMRHEMAHTAFPWMEDPHRWIEEGLATYVESVSGAQSGATKLDELWSGFVKGMPQGQPKDGDEGLDRTHTWGRTYWGGALFCLVADVRIRERTKNRYGLRDALRGIVKSGGLLTENWPIERALAAGDAAVKVPVLKELYDQWKYTPVTVDLEALWKRLGVSVEGETVKYDDGAPLADIRRVITQD